MQATPAMGEGTCDGAAKCLTNYIQPGSLVIWHSPTSPVTEGNVYRNHCKPHCHTSHRSIPITAPESKLPCMMGLILQRLKTEATYCIL